VNVVRFIPSIAGYIYATRGDELFVNLFIGGNATVKLGPRTVKLNQQTRYPWDGAVKLTVTPEKSGEFTLNLRIPGWVLGRPVPGELYRYADAGSPGDPVVTELHIKINGREFSGGPVVNGFLILKRNWKPNDVVEIQMPMPVRRVLAHDAVKANTGRVAIERGPVVYCAEGADNDGQVLNRVLPDGAVLTPEYRPDLFGGVMILRGPVTAVERGPDGSVVPKPADLTLIPYYAWNHRGANEMAVWLPRTPAVAQLPSPPAPARYKASASHCSEHDTVDALSDGLEPENSNDHSIPRFTWWPRKGGTEWVQYEERRVE
jgi:hypothetical protein